MVELAFDMNAAHDLSKQVGKRPPVSATVRKGGKHTLASVLSASISHAQRPTHTIAKEDLLSVLRRKQVKEK